jgi:hypothetical protein
MWWTPFPRAKALSCTLVNHPIMRPRPGDVEPLSAILLDELTEDETVTLGELREIVRVLRGSRAPDAGG